MAKEAPKRYGKPAEMVDGLPGELMKGRVKQRINAAGSAD
jgi:hypothetical protein